MPKTVTLEVTERQAAALLVADQLGKVQLALRGQQDKAPTSLLGRLLASDTAAPVWAADVSRALMPLSVAPPPQRRAQIEVIRGPRVERQCLTEGGFVPCQ